MIILSLSCFFFFLDIPCCRILVFSTSLEIGPRRPGFPSLPKFLLEPVGRIQTGQPRKDEDRQQHRVSRDVAADPVPYFNRRTCLMCLFALT